MEDINIDHVYIGYTAERLDCSAVSKCGCMGVWDMVSCGTVLEKEKAANVKHGK